MSKERLSLLLCANMDGTDKYPRLTIGKSAKPRCFKGIVTLPTEYKFNKKAWMTSGIFCEWIKKFDRKMAGRKIALLLDNCPAHPQVITGLKNTTVYYFPPNTTSILQPMDQGVIANFKKFYRGAINAQYIDSLDNGTDFKLNVLDAMTQSQIAWNKVKAETILNCWFHMTFRESTEVTEELIEHRGLTSEEFNDFVNIDNEVLTTDTPSDAEIIEQVTGKDIENDSESEDESEEPPKPPPPTNKEMKQLLKSAREYFMA